MSQDCIFCKIIRGEIPSARVYEDENVVAFLDISPVLPGHALVVPRKHCERLSDADGELLGRMMAGARAVARAQGQALGAEGVNLVVNDGPSAGQVVMHVHLHVIPRASGDGHRWNWTKRPYASPADMEQTAARLRQASGRQGA